MSVSWPELLGAARSVARQGSRKNANERQILDMIHLTPGQIRVEGAVPLGVAGNDNQEFLITLFVFQHLLKHSGYAHPKTKTRQVSFYSALEREKCFYFY
jgi:hypothetical protein